MNVKILKKLSEKVRLRENIQDGVKEYLVERKSSDNIWENAGKSIRLEKALMKKHNIWHIELHRLNLSGKLLNRRKYGKNSLFKRKKLKF
jgi:predicted NAD-dependent protein-ADP-ribosyltransferase YbiA (DUF1768 family)